MKTSSTNPGPAIIMFWSMPSCSMLKSYKVKSDKLVQAINEDRQVEVLTRKNTVLKLKEIGNEAGKFFGTASKKGHMKKMLLNLNELKMVTLL